jgi:hypothetical protein
MEVVYRPDILIADGAEAITNGFMAAFDYETANDFTRIMCWAHVYRKIEEKARPIQQQYRQEICDDVSDLQTMSSQELFDHAYALFHVKWSRKNINEINTFLEYFKNEWIISKINFNKI